MLMLLRQEKLDKQGVWGVSEPPYTQWTLTKVGFQVGGPNFIALNDSTIIAGSRSYLIPGSYKTMLLKGGLDGRFEQIVVLPSGGDTSYPGFLVVGDELFYNGNSLTNNLIEDRPLVFKRATEDQIKKYQDEADAWYGGADGSEHTITGVGEGWTWAGEIAATAVDR